MPTLTHPALHSHTDASPKAYMLYRLVSKTAQRSIVLVCRRRLAPVELFLGLSHAARRAVAETGVSRAASALLASLLLGRDLGRGGEGALLLVVLRANLSEPRVIQSLVECYALFGLLD